MREIDAQTKKITELPPHGNTSPTTYVCQLLGDFLYMNIFLMVAMERNKRSLLQNYIQMGRYIFFIFQW